MGHQLPPAEHQARAVVKMLKALDEDVLNKTLTMLGVPADTVAHRTDRKPCVVCGLIYPKHVALWSGDHDFETREERRERAELAREPERPNE